MSNVLVTPRYLDDDTQTTGNVGTAEPIDFQSKRAQRSTQSDFIDQLSAGSVGTADAKPDSSSSQRAGHGDAAAPAERERATESVDPAASDHGSGTPMWAMAERTLTTVEEGARHVLSTLTGHQPDPKAVQALSKEVDQVMNEVRIQSLVMEAERQQTSYGIEQASALRQRAMHALMLDMVSIKEFERQYAWAETPQEQAEVAEQSAQLRAQAREAVFRTLEMGTRRIDEQIDRALHPSHPDFPVRTEQRDSDMGASRSILSRLASAFRAFSA